MTITIPAPTPTPAPAPERDWFRIIALAAIIVLAGLLIAAPAFRGTWLWEDDQEISANAAVQGAGNMGLVDIWKPGAVGASYHPVKTTFLWAEWKLFTLVGLRHAHVYVKQVCARGRLRARLVLDEREYSF